MEEYDFELDNFLREVDDIKTDEVPRFRRCFLSNSIDSVDLKTFQDKDIKIKVSMKSDLQITIPRIQTISDIQLSNMHIMLRNLRKVTVIKLNLTEKLVIPLILKGYNIFGALETAPFTLLIPSIIHTHDQIDLSDQEFGPISIIICSSKEIALQMFKVACILCKGYKVKTCCLVKDENQYAQMKRFKSGCHLLVTTISRITNLIAQKQISLSRVTQLMIHGIDDILAMNRYDQMRKIAAQLCIDRQMVIISKVYSQRIWQKSSELFAEKGSTKGTSMCLSKTLPGMINGMNGNGQLHHADNLLSNLMKNNSSLKEKNTTSISQIQLEVEAREVTVQLTSIQNTKQISEIITQKYMFSFKKEKRMLWLTRNITNFLLKYRKILVFSQSKKSAKRLSEKISNMFSSESSCDYYLKDRYSPGTLTALQQFNEHDLKILIVNADASLTFNEVELAVFYDTPSTLDSYLSMLRLLTRCRNEKIVSYCFLSKFDIDFCKELNTWYESLKLTAPKLLKSLTQDTIMIGGKILQRHSGRSDVLLASQKTVGLGYKGKKINGKTSFGHISENFVFSHKLQTNERKIKRKSRWDVV